MREVAQALCLCVFVELGKTGTGRVPVLLKTGRHDDAIHDDC